MKLQVPNFENMPKLDGFYPRLKPPMTLQMAIKMYVTRIGEPSHANARRILALSADYTQDVFKLVDHAANLRLSTNDLYLLPRLATRTETHMGGLLVVAAEECTDLAFAEVPLAIRNNMITASKIRSQLCLSALSIEQIPSPGEQAAA